MMREFISASAVYGFLFMIHTHTHSTIFLGEPGLAFFNTWTKEYKFSGQVACIYIYIYRCTSTADKKFNVTSHDIKFRYNYIFPFFDICLTVLSVCLSLNQIVLFNVDWKAAVICECAVSEIWQLMFIIIFLPLMFVWVYLHMYVRNWEKHKFCLFA